jgi:RHS repeat-associated protein
MKSSIRRRPLFLLAVLLAGLVPFVANVARPLHVGATSGYETAVLNNSPSIYYRFGESSGTTASDDSGNGYNGTYGGGATLGVTGAITSDSDTAVSVGNTGAAAVYTGGTGVPTGNSSRTAEVWYKTSTSGTQLFDWGKVGTQTAFGLYLVDNTTLEMEDWNYGLNFRSPRPLLDGNWHYIAITWDGTNATAYLDGASLGSAVFGHTMATTSDTLDIGANIGAGLSLNGSLDEFAVYSSVLTASQIATHWTAGNAVSCPATPTDPYGKAVIADSPTNYYRFDDSTGRGVADYSGHCRTGAYTTQYATNGVSGALVGNTDTAATLSGSGTGPASGQIMGPTDGLPTGNSARSAEIWFKATTGTPQLFEWGSIGTDTSFGLVIHSSTQLEVEDWTSVVYMTAASSVLDGNWHDVATTYDGTTAIVYVDGSSIGSTSFGHTMVTTTDRLTIGGDVAGEEPFAGSLDEFASYGTTLSAARIRAHYLVSGHTAAPTTSNVANSEHNGAGNPAGSCSNSGSQQSHSGDPVDTESGNFAESFADIAIQGRSCPLEIARTYNSSNAATDGPFGYGWTYNYGMSLSCSGTTATVTQENGATAQFTTSGSCSSGTWSPSAPRFIATLSYASSTWTFKRQNRDTYTFNSSGQLTSITDLNGYVTTLSYTSGTLTTITDPAGRTLTLGWTGSHITSLTDANITPNRTVTYSYTSDQLTDVTDVEGGDTSFAYDGSHRITTVKDPVCEALGGSCPGVQNHYDGSGRVDWQKDQLNRETTFAYSGTPGDATGGTTTITDPVGNVTVDAYEYGVRTSTTRGSGTTSAGTTFFQYDPDTLALTAVVDANGNLTTYTVDSSGNILTKTDPDGNVTTTTYNSFNEPLTVEDGKTVTTTMTYDGDGNLATTSTPASGSSCTCQVVTYNHANGTYPGDVTSMVDPNSKTTSYHYDSNGYQDQVKDPLGNVTGTVHNAIGWVTATYTPKAACTWNSSPPTGCSATYKTAYSYIIPGGSTTDEFGDVQTVTDPLSHVTTYGYDADRNKTSVEDGNSNTTTYAFDVANELTTTTRPDSTTQVTDYNDDGTVKDLKDGAGNKITSYAYDPQGRVSEFTDALNNETDYTYDLGGNKTSQEDPGGNCATPTNCTFYSYDGANNLKTVTYSDGVTPDITSVTYDADNQRTGMTDGTGSSSWAYDNLHRMTSYTNGHGETVTYGYGSDLKNQVNTIAYPNSVGTVTQTWNDDSTLASVEDWNSKTTTFGYDANANETSQTVPSTTNVTDTFGFNAADQMTSVSDSNGSTLFSATYTRDSNGQLSSDNSQAANQANYKYTSLSQLCYAGSGTSNACSSPPASSYPYAFSSADNLTTNNGTTQQFNAADELCWTVSGTSANACGSVPTGGTTFNYDDRGNRTSSVTSGNAGTCTAYDQANRLTSVKTGTGSSCTSPTTVGTYAYDGSGVRESKTVSGTTTQFTWDGLGGDLLQQNAGGTKTSYIYGPGGLPVEQITGSTTTYLHHDQIGSTRLITDSAGATGTATTTAYDPYGNIASSTGSLTSNLMFAGQYLDGELGWYAVRARGYDPTTGTWLTRDPHVASTMSPYAYVAGDPLNLTDPTGLDPLDVCNNGNYEGAISHSACVDAVSCVDRSSCLNDRQDIIDEWNQTVSELSAKPCEQTLINQKAALGRAADALANGKLNDPTWDPTHIVDDSIGHRWNSATNAFSQGPGELIGGAAGGTAGGMVGSRFGPKALEVGTGAGLALGGVAGATVSGITAFFSNNW